MTAADAFRHLQARVAVQRHEKTSYNRLRWCLTDLEAVEVLLRFTAKTARDNRDLRQRREPLVVRPHELSSGM